MLAGLTQGPIFVSPPTSFPFGQSDERCSGMCGTANLGGIGAIFGWGLPQKGKRHPTRQPGAALLLPLQNSCANE